MDVLHCITMKKSGDFFRHIYVCLPKKLLFVFQPTDRQESGFENQHLVINMRRLFLKMAVMYDIMGFHAGYNQHRPGWSF